MARIRPLVRADLPAAAALLRAHMDGWAGGEDFLAETLIDHPWADSELPSLVALAENDEVIGFIGAQPRRMRLDDRAIRGLCISHLVVAPESRGGAPGALLLRTLLSGSQDVTWSDSASPEVARMWRVFGGHMDHVRSCDWMLVLRPWRWLRDVLGGVARRRQLGRAAVPVGALPFHAAGPRLARRAHPNRDPRLRGQDVTASELIESLPILTGRVRLRVDYDEVYLEQLFRSVPAVRGPLVCRLVRRGDRPIGWYAYVSPAREPARVLHLAALDGTVGDVFGDLVEHAREAGAGVLAGRLEPHLEGALRERFAALGLARRPVVHSRDPEVLAVLATGASLLTQLDSEWFVT